MKKNTHTAVCRARKLARPRRFFNIASLSALLVFLTGFALSISTARAAYEDAAEGESGAILADAKAGTLNYSVSNTIDVAWSLLWVTNPASSDSVKKFRIILTPTFGTAEEQTPKTLFTSDEPATSGDFEWDTTTFVEGSYNLKYELVDAGGNTVETTTGISIIIGTPAPGIFIPPQSRIVGAGESVSFSVVATGVAPLSYQWYHKGIELAGKTGAVLTIENVSGTDEGEYTVKVKNNYGEITSDPVTLTLADNPLPSAPPVITSQPQSRVINAGGNVSFSVVATGSAPLIYQWYRNDEALVGETGATLSLSAVAADAAGYYYVTVTNLTGTTRTSSAATLTVIPNPATPPVPGIFTQPRSQVVDAGQTVSFEVVATGVEPMTYQWLFNGGILNGKTSSTLTLTNVTSTQAGNYTVRIKNSTGEVTSETAVLTVTTPPVPPAAPVINTQPRSQVAEPGGIVLFTVTATGVAPLSYQWYFNGAILAGKTEATLEFSNVTAAAAGDYTVEVSNPAGKVLSEAAALLVNPPPPSVPAPKITAHPQSQLVVVGDLVVFSVFASGVEPLAYQWYFNGEILEGEIAATLTLAGVEAARAGSYAVRVANASGEVFSEAAELVVQTPPPPPVPPEITVQPKSQTVGLGSSVMFTVSAESASQMSYQWYFNGVFLAGKNTATLVLANVNNSNAGAYTVLITNAAGITESEVAQLAVTSAPLVPAPQITAQPQSQTAVAGETSLFSVSVTGAAPLAYQWYFNGVALPGKTATVLVLPKVAAANAGVYTVKITNASGEIVSEEALLEVSVPPVELFAPQITAQPQSQTVQAGGAAVFGVTATGTAPLSFQWYFNGEALAGKTAQNLAIPNVVTANAGVYTVTITNAAGEVVSNAAKLTVTPLSGPPSGPTPPSGTPSDPVTVSPGEGEIVPVEEKKGLLSTAFDLINGIFDSGKSTSISQGSTVRYAVHENENNTYQWKRNGSIIAGEAGTKSFYDAKIENTSDRYSVVVTAPNSAPVEYDAPAVKVVSPPQITAQSSGTTVLREGESHTLRVSAKGSGQLYYQWYRDEEPILGAVLETYTIRDASAADAGVYHAKVANYSGIAERSADMPVEVSVTLNGTLAFSSIRTGSSEQASLRSVSLDGNGSFLALATTGVLNTTTGFTSGSYNLVHTGAGILRMKLADENGESGAVIHLDSVTGFYTIESQEGDGDDALVIEDGFFEIEEEDGEEDDL